MNARRRNHRASGMALVEAILSIAIIGIMLTAAMRTVGASRVGQVWNSDRLKAHALAMDLMAEILDQAYVDPGLLPLFGPEVGELLSGRSVFNDVDDYNGWTEYPPLRKDGTAMPGLTGWKRQVDVAWVTAADPTVTSITETSVKRITVTVTRGGKTLAKITALRTAAAPR